MDVHPPVSYSAAPSSRPCDSASAPAWRALGPLPRDDLIEAARKTAALASAEQQHRVVIMIEDQAQYGVGFHLHGFFDKGQPFAGRVLPVFRFRGLKNALDLAEKRLEQAAKQRVLRLIADLDRPDGRTGTFGNLPQRRAPIALFPETRRARLRRFSRPARDFDGPWIRLP